MLKEVLIGFILFFVITGAWSFAIMYMLKRFRGDKINLKGIAYVFSLLIILGAIILASWVLIDYHKEPEFCGLTCHPMVPYYDSYLNPQNNSIMISHLDKEVLCVDCHTGEGIIGQVEAVTIDGTKDLVYLILDNYDPDNLHGFVPAENCLKGCHDVLDWKIEAPVPRGSSHITDEDGTTTWPTRMIWHPLTENGTDYSELESQETCVDCHDQRMNGIGFTRFACPTCHDLSSEEIDLHRDRTCGMGDCHTQPEFIGHRTVMDNCMFCHDRLHPEDARVPYEIVQEHGIFKVDSSFCSDCHSDTYDKLTNSDSAHGWEDGCPECHTDHKYSPDCDDCHNSDNIQHMTGAPYDDCLSCHTTGAHSPLSITLETSFMISNSFCSECHSDQVEHLGEAYHKSQECINCHNEHGSIIVNWDRCNGCHTVPSFHDNETDGCGCHSPEELGKIHGP